MSTSRQVHPSSTSRGNNNAAPPSSSDARSSQTPSQSPHRPAPLAALELPGSRFNQTNTRTFLPPSAHELRQALHLVRMASFATSAPLPNMDRISDNPDMGERAGAAAADDYEAVQRFSEMDFGEDESDDDYQDLSDDEDESDEESKLEPEGELEPERDYGDIGLGEDSVHGGNDMDQAKADEGSVYELGSALPGNLVLGPTPRQDHESELGEGRQDPDGNHGGSIEDDGNSFDVEIEVTIIGSDGSVFDPDPGFIGDNHVRSVHRANSALPPQPFPFQGGRPIMMGDEVQIGVAGPHFTLAPPSLTTFITHHLVPLMPEHPHYPGAGTACPICHEPFSSTHSPVQVVNVYGCRNHIFGYQCLRKTLSSGMGNSKRCPLCRTKWFRMRGYELRRINREWSDVEMAEERAVNERGGGFLGIPAVARRLVGLGKRLAGW